MRILVYGAGVQGSLNGARLFEAGHDVALLARGRRLADLRAHGVILEDLIAKRRTATLVPVVDRLAPDDTYDLVMVPVRREQVASVLPALAGARQVPTILFLHNHAGGTEQLIAAVGRKRVLLGFPGAGGPREGLEVKYLLVRQQRTTLGEIDGAVSARVQQISEVLRTAGFPVAISQNMDAWLKTHAMFVTAVCGALYCAGADNRQLAQSTETLALFADGVREGLRLVRTLGLSPAPLNLRAIFLWVPKAITIAYWRRLFGSMRRQYYFAEHAQVAWLEMKALSNEVRAVLSVSAANEPAFDRLCSAIDSYAAAQAARHDLKH
jgi:2-dehydropantoate 2-reductase